MGTKEKTPAGQQGATDKGKCTHNQQQIQIFKDYLSNNIATASMTAEATGIYQKNITRYKRMLEKSGKLFVVFKAKCKKTGYNAQYMTTNPDYIFIQTKVKQLELF
jgi:predicted Zn-ribbon and HTH transcriptional regulator